MNQTSSMVKIMFLKVKNLFLLLSVLTLVVLTNTVMFVLMFLLPIVTMMEPLQSNAWNVIVNRTISILKKLMKPLLMLIHILMAGQNLNGLKVVFVILIVFHHRSIKTVLVSVKICLNLMIWVTVVLETS